MYLAPYIDEKGLHVPTYSDIRDKLITEAKSIFGDIVLTNDSQDYQYISIISNMAYDTMLLLQKTYSAFGPSGSMGVGLDAIVKLNGLERKVSSRSTADVIITGTPNTIIRHGIITDKNKSYLWDLPPTVSIVNGMVTVTAKCQTGGAVLALPNTLTQIFTPQAGWSDVHNPGSAVPGRKVETDPELRSRQALSTSMPSQSLFGGIEAAVAAQTGVTRSRVYENDTNVVDANGLPPNSISAVVEGGDNTEIAVAIYNKKTPGAYTNGTEEISVVSRMGTANVIRFNRPSYVDIFVQINVVPLAGYTTEIGNQVITTVTNYLNSFAIGTDLTISALWAVAMSVNQDLRSPSFAIGSIQVGRPTLGTSDISIAWNEVTLGDPANITVVAP